MGQDGQRAKPDRLPLCGAASRSLSASHPPPRLLRARKAGSRYHTSARPAVLRSGGEIEAGDSWRARAGIRRQERRACCRPHRRRRLSARAARFRRPAPAQNPALRCGSPDRRHAAGLGWGSARRPPIGHECRYIAIRNLLGQRQLRLAIESRRSISHGIFRDTSEMTRPITSISASGSSCIGTTGLSLMMRTSRSRRLSEMRLIQESSKTRSA